MALFLNHRYQITVTSPPINGKVTTTIITEAQVTGSFIVNSTGTNASPDKHTLTIYNPSVNDLVALREKGAKVKVQAGYQHEHGIEYAHEDLPIIFRGEIVSSETRRSSKDTAIILSLSQGYSAFKSSSVTESFKAGTSLFKVLTALVDKLTLQYVIDLGLDKSRETLSSNQTYNGPTSEVLEKFCRQYRLKWYLEEEILYVVSLDDKQALRSKEGTRHDVNSRVKGIINWTVNDTEDIETGFKSVQVEMNLFLYPTVNVGSKLRVVLEENEVVLVIDSITHTIDYYGNTWDTKIIATSVSSMSTTPEFDSTIDTSRDLRITPYLPDTPNTA